MNIDIIRQESSGVIANETTKTIEALQYYIKGKKKGIDIISGGRKHSKMLMINKAQAPNRRYTSSSIAVSPQDREQYNMMQR